MRQGKDEATDLETLHKMLTEAGIEHEYREHPVKVAEPKVLDLIGYYPTGTHQILVKNGNISIIRGAASFGDFELYSLGDDRRFGADRFATEQEVLEALKNV